MFDRKCLCPKYPFLKIVKSLELSSPWTTSLLLEQNFRVCTGEKYKVYLSGGPVQATLLKKDDNAEYFVAAIAFGQGDDLEHYYWYNQVLLAVLCRQNNSIRLVHKVKLHNEGEYMHRVENIEPQITQQSAGGIAHLSLF